MVRSLVLLALITASVPSIALADDTPKLSAPANPQTDAIGTKFFTTLKTGGGAAATAYVASLSPLFASRQSELQVMATQIDGAAKVYGPIESWERVESEALGSNVRREYFIVQSANNVVRWRLYYTRTPKGWAIGSFTFDDQIQTWF